LGEEVIDDCPTLVDEEDDIVEILTGSRACGFIEYEKSFLDFRGCVSQANEKVNKAGCKQNSLRAFFIAQLGLDFGQLGGKFQVRQH